MASMTNGIIDMVYADVEPLVNLIIEEIWPTRQGDQDASEQRERGEVDRGPGDI